MEDTSEQNTGKPSTDGTTNPSEAQYEEQVLQKINQMMEIQRNGGTWIEIKFMRIPARISNFLCLAMQFAILEFAALKLDNNVAVICFTFASIYAASLVKTHSYDLMVRRRMWEWGRDRFDSFKQQGDWWRITSAHEANRLVGLPDDAEWEPDLINGGELKKSE